jgi:hypothetical protein
LFASLIPLLFIELSQGGYAARSVDRTEQAEEMSETERAKFAEHVDDVEYQRVRDAGWSGLTVALAASLLMVTCQVANERNVRRDVSYFKTSAPGDPTIGTAKRFEEPVKVLLFFPAVNQVKEEVRAYFDALQAASGRITIEEVDRMSSPTVASDHKVQKDGTVVLVRGEGDKQKSEKIELDTDMEKARRGKGKLRNLDREVYAVLLKLLRDKRKAYLTVGHGELNDPDSIAPEKKGRVQERRTTALKKRLTDLNYEAKELGLIDLASTGVPDDATVVLMLAPTSPLDPTELAAIDKYLEKGGRLLVALDPRAEATLGALEGRLGVTFDPGPLTDDKAHLRQRRDLSDRRWAITTQFSAHASTTTLSRSVDKGLLLIDSGALKDAPFSAPNSDKNKRTYVIRSMASTWQDTNENFSFDDGVEKRDRYNVGAAVEGPKVTDKDGAEIDGMRAMVFADADLFADLAIADMGAVTVVMVSGPLLDDAMKWLGGEEFAVGETVSEEDVPIKHTKDKDTWWFLLMIGGVPTLVVALGWFVTRRYRRSHGGGSRSNKPPKAPAKASEVTS